VHSLAERLVSHIRRQELLTAGDRVGIAVSGGIDSVALLRVLLELRGELGIVVSVVHFNHQLRGEESDADQEFVATLAREFDLEFFVDGEDVAQHAADEQVSVETAARELRYGFFRYLLGAEGSPSGAEAQTDEEFEDRGAESAAPPKSEAASGSGPLGLKPDSFVPADGTTEVVPFPVAFRHEPSQPNPLPNPSLPNPPFPNPFFPNSAFPNRSLHEPSLRSSSPSSPALPSAPPARSAASDASESDSSRAGSRLDKIATGHTLDDQAETVLMRVIRGAGVRGLGGIHPRIFLETDDGEIPREIMRPLLTIRRRELEQYLKDISQPWREDSTNTDERFTRNRVRKLVLPLLEQEFNPAVAANLAELAEIARGEEDYWENEVSGWLGTTVQWSQPEWARAVSTETDLVQISVGAPRAVSAQDADLRMRIDRAPWLVMNASVSRIWFLGEPLAVQRRLVKAIGENAGIQLEFKHVEEVLRVAAEDRATGKEVSLPLGWKLLLEPEELVFVTPDLRDPLPSRDYEYELPVPGRTAVYEAGSSIEARPIPAGAAAAYNPDHLLNAESLPGPLRVRNWRPGDRFWPAHTKSPKKIKELLQERHVAQAERKCWPVVVSGEEIVWVRGFPLPANLRAKPGQAAMLILDEPLIWTSH
jgi:tRNA(Ile)-lysidine synthase